MSWIPSLMHARSIPSRETCQLAFKHDGPTELLSILIVVGLIISYLPQVRRCSVPLSTKLHADQGRSSFSSSSAPLPCSNLLRLALDGQHYRIIHHKSSEGFSPFFLLLGATSSACCLLNIITLQWNQVECCRYLVCRSIELYPTRFTD